MVHLRKAIPRPGSFFGSPVPPKMPSVFSRPVLATNLGSRPPPPPPEIERPPLPPGTPNSFEAMGFPLPPSTFGDEEVPRTLDKERDRCAHVSFATAPGPRPPPPRLNRASIPSARLPFEEQTSKFSMRPTPPVHLSKASSKRSAGQMPLEPHAVSPPARESFVASEGLMWPLHHCSKKPPIPVDPSAVRTPVEAHADKAPGRKVLLGFEGSPSIVVADLHGKDARSSPFPSQELSFSLP